MSHHRCITCNPKLGGKQKRPISIRAMLWYFFNGF